MYTVLWKKPEEIQLENVTSDFPYTSDFTFVSFLLDIHNVKKWSIQLSKICPIILWSQHCSCTGTEQGSFGFGDLQSSKKSQANKQPRRSEMGKREAAEEMEDCWDKGTVYIA